MAWVYPQGKAYHVLSAAFWFQRRSSRPGAATTKARVEPALKRGEATGSRDISEGGRQGAPRKTSEISIGAHNSTSKGVKEPQ